MQVQKIETLRELLKKASPKPSKIFTHFATMSQNYKNFERGWEIFYKRSPK